MICSDNPSIQAKWEQGKIPSKTTLNFQTTTAYTNNRSISNKKACQAAQALPGFYEFKKNIHVQKRKENKSALSEILGENVCEITY